VSQPRPERDPDATPDPKPASPDLLASLREVGSAAQATVKEAGSTVSALRTLVAADVSLARSAFGRTLAFTGVAVVFGASAWLLLMAALIVFLSAQLGLPWSASLLGCAVLSALAGYWAVRQGERYFDHTRMQATRRQMARLGIGELAELVPDADSPAPARNAGPAAPTANKDGVDVSPE
jgi:uncharacterized membrane protein YqjE